MDRRRPRSSAKSNTNKGLVVLVPTARGRRAILLLTGVSSLGRGTARRGTAATVLATLRRVLARRRSTVLTLTLCRLAVLSAWRRSTVLAWGRSSILALRRCAVLTLRRLLTILALGRWATVACLSAILAWSGGVRLLILLVVTAVDGAKEELDNPQIRSEVERWVGTGHLFLFVLVV
jgi:hypothetical protein